MSDLAKVVTINDNADDVKVTNCNDKDTISRQAVLDIAFKYCPDDDGTCSEAETDLRDMLDELENLPSAQPELPRWAQKVEKYHDKALKMPHIKKHRAWALYQTYKEYNGYGR